MFLALCISSILKAATVGSRHNILPRVVKSKITVNLLSFEPSVDGLGPPTPDSPVTGSRLGGLDCQSDGETGLCGVGCGILLHR